MLAGVKQKRAAEPPQSKAGPEGLLQSLGKETCDSLEVFCGELRYRYSIDFPVVLLPEKADLGLAVDSVGAIVQCGAAFREHIEKMGWDVQRFISAQPVLTAISYGTTQLPCGGLGLKLLPTICETLEKRVNESQQNITVTLSFESQLITLPSLPLAALTHPRSHVRFGFSFIPLRGTGVVVTEADPNGLFVKALRASEAPFDPEGVLIDCVAGLRVSRTDPQQSFERAVGKSLVEFAMGGTAQMQAAHSKLYLAVRLPLRINQNAPRPLELFQLVFREVYRISLLCSPDHHAAVLAKLQAHRLRDGLAALKNDPVPAASYDNMLKSDTEAACQAFKLDGTTAEKHAVLFDLTRRVIFGTPEDQDPGDGVEEEDRGIAPILTAAQCNDLKALIRDHILNNHQDRIKDACRGKALHKPKREAKIRLFQQHAALDTKALAARQLATVHYMGDSLADLWDHSKGSPCVVCHKVLLPQEVVTHNHGKENKGVVYGSIYNIDTSKCAPVQHFLSKLGWEQWDRVDLCFPQHMHPERIRVLYPVGVCDVRFRAVMQREHLDAFIKKYNQFSDSLKRHFEYDFTGCCVRKPWTSREETREKRKRQE
eukprot:TRINITY_DN1174_c1_g1_i1.p1 TRINITY_DN1174_c1_g1~~TRINITY_DN1174_c1_g1_i1.p1  ORF type:complete len:630 (+),score=203.03 TRINITY_DN1174_c1_g1_i1:96-1892(+)